MIAPFSECSPSGRHHAEQFAWITSFILEELCILTSALQGNWSAVWSARFSWGHFTQLTTERGQLGSPCFLNWDPRKPTWRQRLGRQQGTWRWSQESWGVWGAKAKLGSMSGGAGTGEQLSSSLCIPLGNCVFGGYPSHRGAVHLSLSDQEDPSWGVSP